MKVLACFFLLAASGFAQALLPAGGIQIPALIGTRNEPLYRPMTAAERWRQFRHDNLFGPGAYLRPLKSAMIGQVLQNANWGNDGAAFGKRYASAFGRNFIQGSITDGVAALTGEDTRYFRCTCSGVMSRVRYGLLMTVMTRNSQGKRTVNWALLSGVYGGAAISTTWRPHESGFLVESARVGGIGIGTQVFTNLAREFRPELERMFHRNSLPAWAQSKQP